MIITVANTEMCCNTLWGSYGYTTLLVS